MSTILVKDGTGADKYYGTIGEGTELDPHHSIPADFFLEVSKGNIVGHRAVHVVGVNNNLDNTNNINEIQDTWEVGGVWIPPTQARIHDIASTSANDNIAGTGARTIRIFGLDASFDEIQEDINLNGTTIVSTVNAYTRIQEMVVISFGSTGLNEGNIDATAQTDGTITNRISIDIDWSTGKGRSLSAIFTVPNGKTAYIKRGTINVNKSGTTAGAMVRLRLMYKLNADQPDSGFVTAWEDSLSVEGTSAYSVNYELLPKFPEKTDITIRTLTITDDDTKLSANYDLVLEDNPTP